MVLTFYFAQVIGGCYESFVQELCHFLCDGSNCMALFDDLTGDGRGHHAVRTSDGARRRCPSLCCFIEEAHRCHFCSFQVWR